MLEMHLLSKTCWGSTLRAAAALASQLIMKPIWNLNGFQSNRTILQTQSSPTFKLSWQTWYSKRLCPELLECEPKIFRCPIYNWENTMIASTHLSFWYMSSCCWLKQAPLKWPIHPVLHIVLADGSFNSFSVSWDSYSCSDWIEKCFNMFHIDHLSLYIYIFNIYYIYNIYSIYIISISKRIPDGSRSSLCILARMEGHFQSVLFKGHLGGWGPSHPMFRSVTCLAMLRWPFWKVVGAWALPLWKIWVRQLGWWHSQDMEK